MSNNSNNNSNNDKKRLKQTTINDFFQTIKTNDKNEEITEISSDNQLFKSCNSSQMIVDSEEYQSLEAIDCSQMSDLSQIPETPEKSVLSDDEDIEDEEQLSSLNRMPKCLLYLSPLRVDSSHLVLFNLPINRNRDLVPNPFPNSYSDKWDAKHVKMPNSPINQITSVQTMEGQRMTTRLPKWELIQENLLSDIKCCQQLVEAIKTYNPVFNRYKFDVLYHFFHEILTPEESIQYFDTIIPEMIGLALNLPQIVTQSVPLLRQKQNCRLFLSQKQIACLLANAFFCTFPKRSQTNEEYKNYPIINFLGLFTTFGNEECLNTKTEKLKSIFKYFQTVINDMPKGIVSFERRYIFNEELPVWHNSNKTLRKLVVIKNGVIEKEGKGLLQVDFANKFIGGGVIGSGCVQEEIRFLICPELIISRLFTEKLLDNEVIIISGSQQFSTYSGYAKTFEYTGSYNDITSHDEWGRRLTRIVAMDAFYFNYNEIDIQYEIKYFERELNKAFCGFLEKRCSDPKNKCGIASGNWGCGAFNGDPLLKAIIQLMAASQVDRDLVIFTFNDSELKKKLKKFYTFLTENKCCVKHLYRGVVLYHRNIISKTHFRSEHKLDIFEFFEKSIEFILE